MRVANKILLASTNLDKYFEFQNLFKPYSGIEIIPAQEIIRNADKIQFVETYSTYLENAAAKARIANQCSHYPSLADDSGLEVAALDGRPGVKSRRFAPPRAGISQDRANVEYLLSQLEKAPTRSAQFVCSLALVIEGVLLHATGVLKGTICDKPRGTNGFGYDPIFIPEGSNKTLAEMTSSEKNALSHRAKAVQELMVQVKNHGIVFAKP